MVMSRSISVEPSGPPISMEYPLGVWMQTDGLLKEALPARDTGKNDTRLFPSDLMRRRQS